MRFERFIQPLAILGIQASLMGLWFPVGYVKLTDKGYGEAFAKQFSETFLASFPGGMTAQMYLIGCLEILAGTLAVVSLFRLEAIRGRLIWLRACLALSLVNFAVIGFGLRLIRDYGGAADIFFHTGAIAILYLASMKFEKGRSAAVSAV